MTLEGDYLYSRLGLLDLQPAEAVGGILAADAFAPSPRGTVDNFTAVAVTVTNLDAGVVHKACTIPLRAPLTRSLVGYGNVHGPFQLRGRGRKPLGIPTVFNGEHVAELERPLGGHTPERATRMIA